VLFTQAAEDAETARRHNLCRGGVVAAIGNGSDPAKFHPPESGDPARRALRAELGAGDEMPVIAMIGRLVAEKGYPELIAAMRDVEATLWIIGDRLASDHAGSIDAAVAAAEQDPVLKRRIRFLGYRSDVPALLRAADIFTLPSHREGVPRSIAEAMLTGLPVVATNIRGSREQVVDGETGLLVPVNDPKALASALQRVAGDAQMRARMAAASLARARANFDEALVVRKQLDMLGLVS
jgi:glycosyltransferase involved in cell wall biosynthesis